MKKTVKDMESEINYLREYCLVQRADLIRGIKRGKYIDPARFLENFSKWFPQCHKWDGFKEEWDKYPDEYSPFAVHQGGSEK